MSPNELLEARIKRGAELKALRLKAGISQQELVRRSGLCRYTIVSIETGKQAWSVNSEIIYITGVKPKAI